LEIVKKSFADVPLLAVEGDSDHLSAEVLKDAVREYLDAGNRLLLRLASCDYIDSGGLGVLLSTVKALPPDGWLGIVAANKNVLRLLEITDMSVHPGARLLDDCSTAKESLQARAGQVR
jgi:anti-anti-sigma factor